MLFNSIDFLIFFPIVVLIYGLIPVRVRYIWLLISSYYFYMSWNPKYALLIAFSTVATWLFGYLSDKVKKEYLLLATVIFINLLILFIFKYYNFFAYSAERALGVLGYTKSLTRLNVILPVGISFYTFQALGYAIDVYRGKCKPEKNLLKYALFVSFFPQLVAGPIERSGRLISQIEDSCKKNLMSFSKVKRGLVTMLWGFFLKLVIADRVSLLVDYVYENYAEMGSFALILGAVGFSIQIYCDFNSYSTIAVGAAEVMGFSLMDNFQTPYFAVGIKDFWRRWHISLSTWFRDYLYIPLGGNRCSSLRKNFNVFVTFLVSGLWHGANWTFVVWGALHGVMQIAEDYITKHLPKMKECFGTKFFKVLLTDILVTVAWIFFRADSLHGAYTYIKRMFTCFDPWSLTNGSLYNIGLNYMEMHILWLGILVMFVASKLLYKKKLTVADWVMKQGFVFQTVFLWGMIVFVVIFGKYGVDFDSAQFIYFQF